jgi:hypothetical protein
MIVPLLFATLGGNVPPKLLGHRRAQVDGTFTYVLSPLSPSQSNARFRRTSSDNPSYLLSLLSSLYAVRSSPLWKEPPIFAWLQKTVAAVAPSLDDSSLEDVRIGEKLWLEGPWEQGFAPAGVIRAAYISGSSLPFLPRNRTKLN